MLKKSMESDRLSSKRPNETAISNRQHRQKREKYTLIACNECKKRKVKCGGTTVCQRCETLGLQCNYTTTSDSLPNTRTSSSSTRDMEVKFAALERQVSQLQSVVIANDAQQPTASPRYSPYVSSSMPRENEIETGLVSRRSNQIGSPSFIGPTNSLYSLDIGKSSLRSMGVKPDTEHIVDEPCSVMDTPRHSPKPQQPSRYVLYDILLCMGRDEANRLINIYTDELIPIYPFLNISQTTSHLLLLLNHLKLPGTGFGGRLEPKTPGVDTRDSDILMIVLASALIIEGMGQSDVANYIVDTVEAARCRRARTTPADVKEILICAMLSIYYFHCDEDILAWRMIGSAARAVFEKGLHRTASMMKNFPDEQERSWVTKLFWCIFVLDHRWAFGTGMPCAIHQSDIDSDLPEPDDTSPYLQRLIVYARISSRVLKFVNGSESMSTKVRKDEVGYLDFQIQQWQQAIPPGLQMVQATSAEDYGSQPKSLHRLRVLLYVRANHVKILIHRHSLLSAASIIENMQEAKSVVETARDTIQVLAHLSRTTDIYQNQQACFNYFLLAPLGALFLAVCHGRSYFGESCSSEFYVALDLIRGFSSKSPVSRRLWKTIRDLKSLGPKLGLTPPGAEVVDQPATGVVRIDDESLSATAQSRHQTWDGSITWPEPNVHCQWSNPEDVADIGNQMTYDLADLFGAAQGNARRVSGMSDPMVVGRDDELLSNSCSSLEDNADVSRVLETLF